jgi:hypothetical protein
LPPLAPLSALGVTEAVVAVFLPAGHPLAAGGRRGVAPLGRAAGSACLQLSNLADARWIDAPGVAPELADLRRAAGTEGFRPALRYDGTDIRALLRLSAEGHGLTIAPSCLLAGTPPSAGTPGVTALPVSVPRLVHRVELIHGTLPADSPAAAFAAMLA